MEEKEIINTLSDLKHRIFPRPFERLALKGQKNLVGAEIGVYKGDHTKSLLDTLSIKKLYLIDSYELYNEYEEGKIHYGVDQDSLEIAEEEARRRLENYSNKIVWIKKKSTDALIELPDNLDFVYIDGNHQYEFVKEDIKNYYEKMRKGGILGGHDMYNGFCFEHNGVIRAVTEFSVTNRLQLYVELPDWWIIKR